MRERECVRVCVCVLDKTYIQIRSGRERMCVRLCVIYIYIYIYRERERKRDKETKTKIAIQIGKLKYGESESARDIWIDRESVRMFARV